MRIRRNTEGGAALIEIHDGLKLESVGQISPVVAKLTVTIFNNRSGQEPVRLKLLVAYDWTGDGHEGLDIKLDSEQELHRTRKNTDDMLLLTGYLICQDRQEIGHQIDSMVRESAGTLFRETS